MNNLIFGLTDTGRVRDNNEDLFIAEILPGGRYLLAGVIDGVGGYAGGEVAAALTREVILRQMAVPGTALISRLQETLKLANSRILQEKQNQPQWSAMACVLTLACIDLEQHEFHYIHVGDTRLYLFRDHSLIKISHDQSFVGFLEDSGRLTEQGAMQHPQRNQINQALGLEETEKLGEGYFETGSSPFLPGDLLLACSDGLTDLVNKDGLTAVLDTGGTLTQKAEALVAAANAAGGKDNITVVLAGYAKAAVVNTPPVPAPRQNARPAPGSFQPEVVEAEKLQSGRSISARTIVLSLLCAGLAALSAFLWFSPAAPVSRPAAAAAVQPGPGAREKMLIDTLMKFKGDTLKLGPEFLGSPIKLSRPLRITQDSLVILPAGMLILQADSGYTGPALILDRRCRYVLLEKLGLEHFHTGIVAPARVPELKNVRFSQVELPLQLNFDFTDGSYISGQLTRPVYHADTLEKK